MESSLSLTFFLSFFPSHYLPPLLFICILFHTLLCFFSFQIGTLFLILWKIYISFLFLYISVSLFISLSFSLPPSPSLSLSLLLSPLNKSYAGMNCTFTGHPLIIHDDSNSHSTPTFKLECPIYQYYIYLVIHTLDFFSCKPKILTVVNFFDIKL